MRQHRFPRRRASLACLISSAILLTSCGGGELIAEDAAPVAAPAPAPAPPPAAIGTATLTWLAPSSAVAGYRVYYGTASRTYSQPLGSGAFVATSTFTVAGLASGPTYYFAVTAVDTAGEESAYSNEATKLIR